MNSKDPKLTALQFNEYINNQDINGLSNLMTEDHIFIDRKGDHYGDMVNGWKEFFNNFPTYKNYFTRVESRDNLVILIGYAKWSKDSLEEDHASGQQQSRTILSLNGIFMKIPRKIEKNLISHNLLVHRERRPLRNKQK